MNKAMKHILTNNKGVALITTLLLMVLGFGLVTTLIILVTSATKMATHEQRYTTALEAAKGGADLVVSMIHAGIYESGPVGPDPIEHDVQSASTTECFRAKVTRAPNPNPGEEPWDECGASAINSNPTIEPDLRLTLGGCDVFIKIVDTRDVNIIADDIKFYIYNIMVRSVAPGGTDYAEINFAYRIEK